MQSSRIPLRLIRSPSAPVLVHSRSFCLSSPLRSGHSKWATIKHDKSRNDAHRSKQRQHLSTDIVNAVRNAGPDPNFNPHLVDALARAKKGGLPKAVIESAVLRGQGKSASGAELESLTVEAMVPPVALIVEALTDNKARTLQDVKMKLKPVGGQISPTAYLFEKRGRIVFEKPQGEGQEEILGAALEAGALDVDDEDGDGDRTVVYTEVSDLKMVEKTLVDQNGWKSCSVETIWRPNEATLVDLSEEHEIAEQLSSVEEGLSELSEIQSVYMNMNMQQQQQPVAVV